MQPVYLGLFSKIFSAIFDAILKPIIEFFGKLLSTILGWLFENVLKPILINVFLPIFKAQATMAFEIIADVLFDLYTYMLWLVDLMAEMFNVFGGVSPVKFRGEDTYLMIALLQSTPVMRAVWGMIGLAFVLMLLFSGIAVIRSIGELGNEVQRPLSKVLHNTFQSFIKLITIPFVCLVMILGTSVVLNAVNNGLAVMNDSRYMGNNDSYRGTKTTIGRAIFVVSTLDAAHDNRYNITHTSDDQKNGLGINDALRAKYYYTDYAVKQGSNYVKAAVDYRARDNDGNLLAKKDFKPAEIDYLIGIALGLLFLYTMVRGVLTFISRIFSVFLLTLAAPFMGSTIPLDDGKKYDGWKELYVGQFFSAFGLLIGMQVYVMLIPVVMDGGVLFGNGTVEANYLIRLVMMGGGAYMIKDVGPTITGLVSSAAANLERSSNQGMMGNLTKVGMEAWDKTKMAYGAAKSLRDKLKSKEKKKDPESNPGDAIRKRYLGGLLVKGKGADGKEHWGFNMGSKLNFGLRGDGSVGGNVFGIGWKKGKDGKLDKLSVPFVRLKRGADGKMSVSKIKLSKGMQLRRTETVDKDGKRTLGSMYCSDLSAIGLKRRFDADTGKVETQSVLGVHYAKTKDADGKVEYAKTHWNFLGTTSVYDRDKQGNYHVVARKGFLANTAYSLDKDTGETTLKGVKSFGGRSLYEDTEDEEEDDDGGDEGDET